MGVKNALTTAGIPKEMPDPHRWWPMVMKDPDVPFSPLSEHAKLLPELLRCLSEWGLRGVHYVVAFLITAKLCSITSRSANRFKTNSYLARSAGLSAFTAVTLTLIT